jgi:peptide/nickel transport system permease protein
VSATSIGRLAPGQLGPAAGAGARVLAKLLGTLVALSLITFLATTAVPTDPALVALGRTATPQELRDFRHQEGLDRPLVSRYVHWAEAFVTGDWGTSIINQEPVRREVLTPLTRTVILAISAFLLGVPLAFGLGLLAGRRSGSWLDRGTSLLSLSFLALPEFVIAIVLLIVFAVRLRLFPVDSGALAFGNLSVGETARLYALPVITLALILIPYITRLMRANVRDVIRQPYIRAAELQGVRGWRISARRIAPNAAKPLLSVLAITLAELVAGVVVVETVFGFPGAGSLLVSSVESQDIPTVQALVLLIGAMLIVFNLLADLGLVWLNPRLRRTRT